MGFGRVLVVGTLAVAAATVGHAQRRVPAPGSETVPVVIALKADGKAYNFSGQAKCTHAPVAAIYGLRAERWTVDRSESGALPATLALWHPASGPDLVSLSFTIGDTRHDFSTIKVGSNGKVEGSGTITLAREGKGGTFTVNATSASGAKLTGTVKCDAFTPAFAEGGL